MSDNANNAPELTGGVNSELAQQAAAQMRRPAPGQEPKSKRPKKEDGDKEGSAADKDTALPVVWRYAYDAPDRLAQGATAVLLTCNMRNEKTSTREVLSVLPEYISRAAKDTQPSTSAEPSNGATAAAQSEFEFSLVKVGVQGLVTLLVQRAAPKATEGQASKTGADTNGKADAPEGNGAAAATKLPSFLLTAAVHQMMSDMDRGTRTKFQVTQRVYPFETTCVFTPEALKAHVAQAVRAFSQSEEGKELRALHEAGKTIKFAAAFKNRNTGKNVPTWNGKDLQANDPHPYTLDTTTTTSPATTTKPASEGASAQGAAKEGARDPEAAFTALAPKSDKPAPNAAAALRSAVLHLIATSCREGLKDMNTAVDLSTPDFMIFCEVMPVSGQLFAGIAVVPSIMGKAKPNISLKTCHA